jgi:2'-5' RNA ligase
VLPVPEADAVVGRWRERFEPSGACGMPAHITVLFPFLSFERVGSDELDALNRLFADADTVPVRFAGFGSFPQVLYLRPEPAGPLVELTSTVVGRWPEAPPYGGTFAEVVPHLTVAAGIDEAVAGNIRSEIGRALPFDTVLREACLFAFGAGRWTPVETFALRSPRPAA